MRLQLQSRSSSTGRGDGVAAWGVVLLHHCTIQSQRLNPSSLPDLKSSAEQKNAVFTCGSQSGAAQLRAGTRAGAAETKLGGRWLGAQCAADKIREGREQQRGAMDRVAVLSSDLLR